MHPSHRESGEEKAYSTPKLWPPRGLKEDHTCSRMTPCSWAPVSSQPLAGAHHTPHTHSAGAHHEPGAVPQGPWSEDLPCSTHVSSDRARPTSPLEAQSRFSGKAPSASDPLPEDRVRRKKSQPHPDVTPHLSSSVSNLRLSLQRTGHCNPRLWEMDFHAGSTDLTRPRASRN